jgi:tryptophan synthase alpha chain
MAISRISETFRRLRRHGRKALIPFVMGGDPAPSATAPLLVALAESGADVLEVGIPFSDPLADGPTIQKASQRALEAGTTPRHVFAAMAAAARRTRTPIVILSYWNPILRYHGGPACFLADAARSGALGVIVPDLPVDESDGWPASAAAAGVDPVFLAAPTSSRERLRRIARASRGFIYYVSLTGTTGARTQLSQDWRQGVRELKLITTTPVCVGFGISTPSQAAEVARVADGAIIGSALIRALEPHLTNRLRLVQQAASFMRRFRVAV